MVAAAVAAAILDAGNDATTRKAHIFPVCSSIASNAGSGVPDHWRASCTLVNAPSSVAEANRSAMARAWTVFRRLRPPGWKSSLPTLQHQQSLFAICKEKK